MNCHRFSRHTNPTLSGVTSKGDPTYKCDHPHAIRLSTHDPGRGVIYRISVLEVDYHGFELLWGQTQANFVKRCSTWK